MDTVIDEICRQNAELENDIDRCMKTPNDITRLKNVIISGIEFYKSIPRSNRLTPKYKRKYTGRGGDDEILDLSQRVLLYDQLILDESKYKSNYSNYCSYFIPISKRIVHDNRDITIPSNIEDIKKRSSELLSKLESHIVDRSVELKLHKIKWLLDFEQSNDTNKTNDLLEYLILKRKLKHEYGINTCLSSRTEHGGTLVFDTKISDGQRVRIIMGNNTCDIDSAVCAVVYANYLKRLYPADTVIPIYDIARDELSIRHDVIHVLQQCQVDYKSIVYKNELDLKSLCNQNTLNVVLVDHHVPVESDLDKCVVEIFDHRPKVRDDPPNVAVHIEQVASCATVLANYLLNLPQYEMPFLDAKLLYYAIITDTLNMSDTAGAKTDQDELIAKQLESKYDGLVGNAVFAEIEAIKKREANELSTMAMLIKDYKSTTNNVGISATSSIVMEDFIQRSDVTTDMDKFVSDNNLRALLVTFVELNGGNIIRQLLIYSADDKLREGIFSALDSTLGLIRQQCSIDNAIACNQLNPRYARKTILPLTQQYVSTL